MTPTKLLLGQIVVVLAIVLVGNWFTTQWVAVSWKLPKAILVRLQDSHWSL